MLNWLSERLRPRQTRPSAPIISALAAHHSPFSLDQPGIHDQAGHIYAQSPWVYVAVNRIAEAAALVPLNITGHGSAASTPNDHPLQQLLNAPNHFLSRFELLEQTVGTLELYGNAYWYLVGDQRGRPVEIWPLQPDRLRIVPDPERFVRGYVYELDGQRIPLEPAEIVHFKRWHPANDFYGLSALQAARLAVMGDRAMASWNHAAFGQDRGIPAGMVVIKDFISEADFERLKRDWRETYGGGERRTAFLRGGEIEWQNIGLSHQDLDFLQGRAANRDEILNIFGVPIGMLSENATEANAKVAERLFIERTLWPKLTRIAAKITQDLLPFWPGSYTASFEDIRPTDTQARLDEIRTASAALSINEIRDRYYHLPPVVWGAHPPTFTPDPPPNDSPL